MLVRPLAAMRPRAAGFATALLVAACASGAPTASAATDACPNAAIRAAQGAQHLPDCRAWERVSPDDKNSSDVHFHVGTARIAPSGDKAAFVSTGSFAGGGGGSPRTKDYVATRTPSGWSTDNVTQAHAPDPFGGQLQVASGYRWLSRDLTRGVYASNDHPDVDRNLHLRDFGARTNTRLTPPMLTPLDPVAALFYTVSVADATEDGRHVLFESDAKLTPDAPEPDGQARAYEWADGEVRLVGVLPEEDGGGAAAASMAGRGIYDPVNERHNERAMSDDGSRIYFTSVLDTAGLEYTGDVYLRVDGEETIRVSKSQRTDCADDPTCGGDGTPDPIADPYGPGKAKFLGASRDGSVAYIGTCRQLTDDSTSSCEAGDTIFPRYHIYRYEVETGDLTNVGEYEDILGVSDDGSYVYYLLGWDIQVWRNGSVASVASLESIAAARVVPRATGFGHQSRVSADGRYIVHAVGEGLSEGVTGHQLHLYDAESDTSTCISCTENAPSDASAVLPFTQSLALNYSQYLTSVMDAAGRHVYFSTDQPLVPHDVNGRFDVYQYDIATGARSLISSGRKAADAWLGDVAPDDRSVAFVTAQSLADGDDDDLRDLYVARVDGGFPQPPPAAERCSGDACQGPEAPQPERSPLASSNILGAGNVAGGPRRRPVTVAGPRLVRGAVAVLKIRVPAAGRISLSGKAVRASRRAVRKTGLYRVRVKLDRQARRALSRRPLSVRVRVTFEPRSGPAVSKRLTLGFKRAGGR